MLETAAHHSLVMIYAPWCSRSKRLAPQWAALARRYKRDGGLAVAKIDASANELRYPEAPRHVHGMLVACWWRVHGTCMAC